MPARNQQMGKRIRDRRGNRTLQEIASAAGISPSHVQRYEEGRIPRGDILERLSLVLGVSSRLLLTGEAALAYKEGGGCEARLAEPPATYLGKKEKRLMDEIDKLLASGDEVVFQHLKQQVALLHDAVEHRREKGKV